MGHVYKERCEVHIPDYAHLNRCDGRVYILNNGNPLSRTTIGWATSDETFHPNDNFRKLYPQDWEKAFSKYNDPKVYELRVGMYGLCLGAGYKSGLYPTLVKAYDGRFAADIMDYVMYSLLQRDNVSQLYSERMRDQILFSEKVHSDSYWSRFFKEDLQEWQHDAFKELWLKTCIARGAKSVWVCIDGSNNDCQMEESDFAEYGNDKSHSGKTITGFIYAVDAHTGEPLTYFVNPGGVVDSQALHKIINFLVGYHLEVEGVILDRGFCTYEDIQVLKGLHLKYVIMVPSGTKGHKTMLREYGRLIFWKTKYAIESSSAHGIFGISREEVIWTSHPDETGFLNLYFGGVRGCFEGIDFLNKVFEEKKQAEEICSLGQKPVIDKKFKDILVVDGDEKTGFRIFCDYDAWDECLQSTGFFTILSSHNFGPRFVFETYQMRIISEIQYRILKSQEGYDTTRVHSDSSMLSRYAICFVTCVLRYWIMNACQKHNLDTNVMIHKMNRIRFLVNEGGKVVFIRDIQQDALDLFEEFSMDKATFEELASEFNIRAESKIKSEIRTQPNSNPGSYSKPRRGRPLGSKNKKTLAREAAQKAETGTAINPEQKKRGRPFGSKDSIPRKKRSDSGVKRGPRNK